MTLLTKLQILTSEDRPYRDVDVPEWGGTVRVRKWSGMERDRYEELRSGEKGIVGIRAVVAAFSIVDENGTCIFTDKDIDALGAKSGTALDRVLEAVLDLNGLTEKSIGDIEKNSDSGQSDNSGTT